MFPVVLPPLLPAVPNLPGKNRNHGTGSIRQRSANGYSIRYYGLPDSNGKRTRVEETVKGTKKVAERLLRVRLAALDTGDFINKQKATVKQFLDQWLDVYGNTNLAENNPARLSATN